VEFDISTLFESSRIARGFFSLFIKFSVLFSFYGIRAGNQLFSFEGLFMIAVSNKKI